MIAYRPLRSGENVSLGDVWPKKPLRPVEVDEWHPASQPPKWDFEPLGLIEVIWEHGNVTHETPYGCAVIWAHGWEDAFKANQKLMPLHWRKITPPKQIT